MLEPGKAAKTDKSSIITDAIRIVTQLRAENGQLRQLNKFLEVPALLRTHRSHTHATICNLFRYFMMQLMHAEHNNDSIVRLCQCMQPLA